MKNDKKITESLINVIIGILVIILSVLVLFWIFPSRNYVKKLIDNNKTEIKDKNDNNFASLFNQIFSNNINSMKEAAISYFTNERLPKKIGETKKMTLAEMYDKSLVLELKDKNNSTCNTKKSYVEVTKYKNEYKMKINLTCSDEEDYIIVYLGCYDYCKTAGVCEKKVESVKKYICEYKKGITGSWGQYLGWSNWTTEEIQKSASVDVETKVENIISGYSTTKSQVGVKTESIITGYTNVQYITDYKVEKYVSGYKKEKYIADYIIEKYITDYKVEKYVASYIDEKVKVGTEKVKVGETTQTITESVLVGTTNQYVSSNSGTTIPSNGNGYVYVKTGSKTSQSCSSCATVTIYTWDVYKVVNLYESRTVNKVVPVFETRDIYETKKVPVYKAKKVPIYGTRKVPVYSTKNIEVYATRKVPVYGIKKVPIYSTIEIPVYADIKTPLYNKVTYYRSRIRKYVDGTLQVKWGTCDPVDNSLINKGYVLTGKKRVA